MGAGRPARGFAWREPQHPRICLSYASAAFVIQDEPGSRNLAGVSSCGTRPAASPCVLNDERHSTGRVATVEIEVSVGGWEHQCCGAAISRRDRVTWQIFRYGDELIETHHELELDTVSLSGRVLDIRARFEGDEAIEIDRLPSGSALTGNDEHDDGALVAAWTEAPLERSSEDFLVRLEVADGTALPAPRPG